MMQIIVSVIAVLIFIIGNCDGYVHPSNESIFKFGSIKDYCDMSCGGSPHALCRSEKPKKCPGKYYIKEMKLEDKLDMLEGFNGLRDRIADKMQVANMVMLAWDDELEKMAEVFLEDCDINAHNPCTNLGDPNADRLAQEKEPRYYHIDDCNGFRKSLFFPLNFFASILRDWYYEKNNLDPPIIKKTEFNELYGVLKGHNSFTKLANPVASRVGCGIARYDEGYALYCLFFPYFQSDIKYYYGAAASTCPTQYPLKGEMFPNLCTNRGIKLERPNIMNVLLMSVFVLIYTYGYRMFRLRVQRGSIFWQKWNW